mmetsp:Transcript_108967/g.216409  ORF Transcript_108967/g.216409 Transcript_108967/m.216409 type:complete len:100 (+) Transcript_108967:516-815(+)
MDIQWKAAAWEVIRWPTWAEDIPWLAWAVATGTWETAVTMAGLTHNLFTMRLLRLQDASQMVAGSSETIGQPSAWDHVNCCKATSVKNVEIFFTIVPLH